MDLSPSLMQGSQGDDRRVGPEANRPSVATTSQIRSGSTRVVSAQRSTSKGLWKATALAQSAKDQRGHVTAIRRRSLGALLECPLPDRLVCAASPSRPRGKHDR